MARFNRPAVRAQGSSPLRTEPVPSAKTWNQGPGYLRDAQSELFLRATSSFGNQGSHYEAAAVRDDRQAELVSQIVVTDEGWAWFQSFVKWLRRDGNMRTSPLMLVAEATRARHVKGLPMSRSLVDDVLMRADEPGELYGYWQSRGYGRHVPYGMKVGISRALRRLVTPYSVGKWDTASHGVRFGDMIDLFHVEPKNQAQSDLFRYCIDKRHGRDDIVVPESLLAAVALKDADMDEVTTSDLKAAGATWNKVLSQAGKDADRKRLWEQLIPAMPYQALLQNLRNFDQDGVSDAVALDVCARLADPAQVAKSGQFPYKYLAAQRELSTYRWNHAIDLALTASLDNVPHLPGRSLIMVDTSGSMANAMSDDSKMRRWDSAVIFAMALAHASAHADVVSFSGRSYYHEAQRPVTKVFPLVKGESPLHALGRFQNGWFLQGGTDTALAIQAHYQGHDRVIVITDEQASRNSVEVSDAVPAHVPLHTVNVVGYTAGHAGGPRRHVYGGLTDAGLRMIGLVDAGSSARWPWEQPVD